MRTYSRLGWAVVTLVFLSVGAQAVEISQAEWDKMKQDIADLRKQRQLSNYNVAQSNVTQALDNKYGPNADAYTRTGKLRIGGLTQIWYFAYPHRDKRGLFDDPHINNIPDSNAATDNSSFRVRRAELHMQMDMTENVTSYVFMDAAREITSYPGMPVSQVFPSNFIRQNLVAPEFNSLVKPNGINNTSIIAGVQSGGGTAGRSLQDAWIDYHDVVPHHDFLVGQVHPWFGEEDLRSNRELDFIERSQIGFVGESRDLGASIHGMWWDVDEKAPVYSPQGTGRFQYWLDVMDGAGTIHSAGAIQNRPDDNNAKDFGYRVLVRPSWKNDYWGSSEVGFSSQFGEHGGGGNQDPVLDPTNGLNRKRVWAYRHGAWGYFAPGSILKGWWTRGEWAMMHDRLAPNSIIDLTGNGDTATTVAGKFKPSFVQTNPHPFTTQGWYVTTAYKMADSIWFNDDCHSAPEWLKPFEFLFRYDVFQNVQVADPSNNGRTLLYKTGIYTAGINYYIKGHNAKIQMNYNWIRLPDSNRSDIFFHRTDCNNFMLCFQVGF